MRAGIRRLKLLSFLMCPACSLIPWLITGRLKEQDASPIECLFKMISLATGRKIAIEIGNRLQPYCDRLNIAGSIRRGKLEVGDIELVCQPRMVSTGQVDLFGVDTTNKVVHAEFVRIVNSLGKVIKGKPDGRMMCIEVDNKYGGVREVQLDMFMPQPHDYFRQYAVRTGSREYSHKVLASAWRRMGWVGTEDGLRLELESVGNAGPDNKVKWLCLAKEPTLPPVWKSEQEFFDWLNIQYLPPNVRVV